ncbi:MAG: type IV pilus assembly protein PilZ [Phenylobacterium sp.]|jgi:type IV pilus assembly protein PilZ
MIAAVIDIEFDAIGDLYSAYMPYLKTGGLFVRTQTEYEMGAEVILSVTLPDALEAENIGGKVVWITPTANQSATPCGIGVGFGEDKLQLQSRIEKSLGSMLNSGEPTFTM